MEISSINILAGLISSGMLYQMVSTSLYSIGLGMLVALGVLHRHKWVGRAHDTHSGGMAERMKGGERGKERREGRGRGGEREKGGSGREARTCILQWAGQLV